MVNSNPYLFVVDVVPMQENTLYKKIAGAKAHIWVISTDKENAKLHVINYNNRYLWEIINFEYEFEIREEQIPKLREDELYLYKIALRCGIAADYIAYLKET